jgi:competence CoiA-like predicted nuclease
MKGNGFGDSGDRVFQKTLVTGGMKEVIMPFIAIHKPTGKRVDATREKNLRQTYEADSLACQQCGGLMIPREGKVKRTHFAHRVECTSEWVTHPETPEHLNAKAFLRDRLNEEFFGYTNVQFELEVKVPEVMRIADVMATFPMGWRIAHEVQLASITVAQLEERTNDYARAGVDVVWWLGKSADTPANRNWCLETFGECYSIDADRVSVFMRGGEIP